MKSRLLIIFVFTILLITSLMISSQWGSIQKEIWFMTGEYVRGSIFIPMINYDYELLYATVLEIFGIVGIVIIGINLVMRRKRK